MALCESDNVLSKRTESGETERPDLKSCSRSFALKMQLTRIRAFPAKGIDCPPCP